MKYDNKNGCKHQNEVEVGEDTFILCKLREPITVRCKKGTCKEYEK